MFHPKWASDEKLSHGSPSELQPQNHAFPFLTGTPGKGLMIGSLRLYWWSCSHYHLPEKKSHSVYLWMLQSVGASGTPMPWGALAASPKVSSVSPVKGEFRSEIRFGCIHNVHFIKLQHLSE